MEHTLLSLGISSADLLARGVGIDRASQRLLIDAADELPPTQERPTATVLSKAEASAALISHARATVEPPTGTRLCRLNGAEQEEPEPGA